MKNFIEFIDENLLYIVLLLIIFQMFSIFAILDNFEERIFNLENEIAIYNIENKGE